MALLQSSEISVGYIWQPLIVSSGIEVTGNVAAAQQYDIASNTYTPDYTATYLQLRPWMAVADPDGELTDGEVTPANVTWEAVEAGTAAAITAGAQYAIAADGTLTLKRNVDPGNPLTLRVRMEYLDPRTGALYRREESILVTCESISAPPVLSLDVPVAVMYDPVFDKDNPLRTITASLMLGSQEVPASKRRFIWQKKDAILDWHEIHHDETQNDLLDYDVHLSADGTQLTVDCEKIGKRVDIRCYAIYAPFGSLSSMTIGADTPMEEFAVVRSAPKLNGVVLGPGNVSPSLKNVRPELRLYAGLREITDPETVCDIVWKLSKGVAAGTVSYGSVVAQGAHPTLPTTSIAQKYGGKATPFYGVKLPWSALKDPATGKYLTLADGTVLLGRPRQT